MDTKECPSCKEVKNEDQFYFYFSKIRNKKVFSIYCPECYLKKNREKQRKYYKENKERIIEKQRNSIAKKIYREKNRDNLEDVYVASKMSRFLKITYTEAFASKELLEVYRNKMKLQRKIKEVCQKQN